MFWCIMVFFFVRSYTFKTNTKTQFNYIFCLIFFLQKLSSNNKTINNLKLLQKSLTMAKKLSRNDNKYIDQPVKFDAI